LRKACGRWHQTGMDMLEALRLQIEWGADEALAEAPVDHLHRPSAAAVSGRAESAPPPHVIAAAPSGSGTPPERARAAAERAATLAELAAAITGFEGCRLRDTAAHTILVEGDPSSRLLLVGEAPSADDDRNGRPLTGPAGAYLDKMLASIGLDRQSVLLVPLLPWRPPGDRPPSSTELATCLPFLIRLFELSRPPLLLLCGPLAARALLGTGGSKRIQRGKWVELPLPGTPALPRALPTHSPDLVRRDPTRRREAWADLRALRRALDGLITAK
jgi:uracil-DNA glycosylase